MLKPVRKRHGDATTFIAYVLWNIGFSTRSIAIMLHLRTKQVAGIIDKSPYRNRTAMSDEERRRALLELQELRLDDDGRKVDGGRLDNIRWEVKPLRKPQLRAPTKRRLK